MEKPAELPCIKAMAACRLVPPSGTTFLKLDNTVAALMKGYIKIERELVESLKFSSTFYDKLQKTVANIKEKKKELENIHSGKLKLDELNVILL